LLKGPAAPAPGCVAEAVPLGFGQAVVRVNLVDDEALEEPFAGSSRDLATPPGEAIGSARNAPGNDGAESFRRWCAWRDSNPQPSDP